MRKAVEAIMKKEMGYCKATVVFNVPKSTLKKRYVDEQNTNPNHPSCSTFPYIILYKLDIVLN